MVPRGAVSVLGQPPFHAVSLTSTGALAYVGGNWERDVAFAGYAVPLAVSGMGRGGGGQQLAWPQAQQAPHARRANVSRAQQQRQQKRRSTMLPTHPL